MADDTKGVSRRDLLKRAGLAGAALTIPAGALSGAEESAGLKTRLHDEQGSSAAPRREPIENLTAYEADLLEAICARIIPTDANGPGAREARAAHYIDRALGGALSGSKQAYSAGLAAFDAYCRSSRRAPFTELSTRDQDSVLIDVETGAATGFVGSSAVFFAMLRTHTLQGTFGDPYYGGNYNFIGWDMIGYPGVRTNVSAEDQRLGANLKPNHQSAYDNQMFTKAQALRSEGTEENGGHGGRHGH